MLIYEIIGIDRVNELFKSSTTVPYELKDLGDEYSAKFAIGNVQYETFFEKDLNDYEFEGGIWDFSFALMNSQEHDAGFKMDNTGTGNEFIVYNTVLSVLREFITKVKPAIINFEARGGRISLYARMMQRLRSDAIKLGYYPEQGFKGSKRAEYAIVRKDLSLDPDAIAVRKANLGQ